MSEMFVVVDVGCIECGEQTEVIAICETMEQAQAAFESACTTRGIKKWEPRGGFLELLGTHGKNELTYIGGTGYFTGGQRALEIHVFPPRKTEAESEVES